MLIRLPVVVLALGLLVVSLPGCSGDPGTGPVEVKWDRVACERCRMVLSDRRHAAQIRFTDPGGKSRIMFFDDIGCAVIWLDDKPWKDAAGTEIWVNDHRDGRWIDARKAYYVEGGLTPMEYGLGAQDEPAAGAMSFEQAIARIWEIEKRFNRHGADVREQSRPRGGDAPAITEHRH
ncbi:MAG: hypothetical protein Kow006_05030 [Gammaproteobacteria bacterium]